MVDYDNVVNADGEVNWDAVKDPTPKELDEIATLILRADVKKRPLGIKGENPILFEEHLKNRHKREIFNKAGVPDPAFGQGIYNRQHPEGRKVNSDEQRKRNGASYYR